MNIAIVGAGPAGIYTSLLLNEFMGEVHLFEQNADIGEKLKTTGGGRMNVTNKIFSDEEFSSSQKRFVERMFKNPHFDNRYDILEKLGIKYRWEKNRAILESQDAVAEVARLKKRVEQQANIQLRLSTKITAIEKNDSGFFLSHGKTTERFDIVVLTGGGMYRMGDMGEKEKIYHLPLSLGHTITDVSPSLCPLLFPDKSLRQLSGITFEGVLRDKDSQKTTNDDLLITHFGISGPGALDFSSYAGNNCEISFINTVTEDVFINLFNEKRQGKHSIKGFLKQFMPQRLAVFHLERSNIDQDNIADLPKAKLKALVESIFHYPIPPRKTNIYPGSWTTKGGIQLDEVQTKNLGSKKVENLYFAGEILDFNGLCGGYNISFAMISAHIVADDIFKQHA